jgi:hypothetical protein
LVFIGKNRQFFYLAEGDGYKRFQNPKYHKTVILSEALRFAQGDRKNWF